MPVDPIRQRQLFDQALDRPAEERAAFLDDACAGDPELRARIDKLLASLAAAGEFFAEPSPREGGANERAGGIIGRYELLQRIGEGGFGTVWMAEQQEPVRRKVALKVIKLGMDTRQVVARFEAERQALALMEHPNIAKVFDGGVTPGGRPYFVMELIAGVSITEYCDRAGLDMPERLELFQQVCHAVQHAHQKGVIHRDLKPNNILVTLHDGVPVPKVIDFGVAKATSAELTAKTLFTEFRHMVGTPEYMAPEQAEMSGLDVDTRADVYSLGVVLYEMLTGSKPFDTGALLEKGYLEMLRVVREDPPPKPSTRVSTLGRQCAAVARRRHATPASLSRLLQGDLDWIVMKALEKERSQRYVTANDFAADVGRHLQHEPVQAGPPSAFYRLRKYVRRHRLGFFAGSAVVLALVAGLAVALWGWWETDAQRARAEKAEGEAIVERNTAKDEQRRAEIETARANAVIKLFERMLGAAGPGPTRGRDYTVRQLLDDFDRGLGKSLANQPEIEATLRYVMGQVYLGLGLHEQAEAHTRVSVELRRGVLGDEHPDVANSLTHLTHCLQPQGKLDEAEARGREALSICRKLFGEEHASVAVNLGNVAWILQERGMLEEAEAMSRHAVAMNRRIHGPRHPEVATTLHFLSVILLRRSKLEEAEEIGREGLEIRYELDDKSRLASELRNLGNVLMLRDELAEAETMLRESLALDREILGDGNPIITYGLDSLGQLLERQGKHRDAEIVLRESLARCRALPSDHTSVARGLHNLAGCLMGQARFEEAEPMLRESVDVSRECSGNDHLRAAALGTLGACLARQGRPAEAEPLLREALDSSKLSGRDHVDVAILLSNLGTFLMMQERLDEAEPLLREALDTIRESLGNGHQQIANVLDSLSKCLAQQRKVVEAEELLRESLAIRRKRNDPEDLNVGRVNALAGLLERQEKVAEREAVFREALTLARRQSSADLAIGNALTGLGSELLRQGRYDDAEPLLREDLETRTKTMPDSWWRYQAMSLLGGALSGQGKHAEAEPLLLEGYAKLQPPAAAAALRVQALDRVIALYESWGRPDDAATWRSKRATSPGAGK